MKHTTGELAQMQALPLWAKVRMTERRIKGWYEHWDGEVYVSFSGGKDSTVLLDIARGIYPDVEAVFVNTGLEYPEIQQFVKTFDNVTILRPEMRFDEVIKRYGYPVISKEVSNTIYSLKKTGEKEYLERRMIKGYCNKKYKEIAKLDFYISEKCCNVMKKKPTKSFTKETNKKPITAQMACESSLRLQQWQRNGCNGFDMKSPVSNPMSFWTEQDVLEYVKAKDLRIASVYGSIEYATDPEQIRWHEIDESLAVFESKEVKALTTTGCDRTGCIFCGFGCHLDASPGRFERLKQTHPRQYKYCIEGGEYNDEGIWQPNKQGLGMGHVFDELNKLYGEDFIKY